MDGTFFEHSYTQKSLCIDASGIFALFEMFHPGWNVELYVTRVPREWMVRGPSRSIAIRMILGGEGGECGKHEQKSIVPRYL